MKKQSYEGKKPMSKLKGDYNKLEFGLLTHN